MPASTTGEHGLGAVALLDAAVEGGLSLAVAESLTGGLVAAALVSVSGASRSFWGGVVAYHAEVKRTQLGVDAALLASEGPVHPLVASAMARGVRSACSVAGARAAVGIATTGVAGPDPDPQTGQLPGTAYIGVSSDRGDRSVALHLRGSREEIRVAVTNRAIAEALIEVRALLISGAANRRTVL